MGTSQHIEAGDSGGSVLMRDGEEWVLIGTTFYSYGADGQLAAQRVSYYLPWIAQYVEGTVVPPTTPPATTTAPSPFAGATISLRNRTASQCRVDDLFTTTGAVSAPAGGSVDLQIEGRAFRTVLLVECGQP